MTIALLLLILAALIAYRWFMPKPPVASGPVGPVLGGPLVPSPGISSIATMSAFPTGPIGPTGPTGIMGMTGPTGSTGFIPLNDLDAPLGGFETEDKKFFLKAAWNQIPTRLLNSRIKFLVFREKSKIGPVWEESGVSVEIFVGKEGKRAISDRLVDTLSNTGKFPEEVTRDQIFDFVDAVVDESRKIFMMAAMGEWCSFVPLEEVERCYKEALVKNVMGK